MLLLSPGMDFDQVVDFLIAENYPDEFCIAQSFAPDFIQSLMEAGFLVMSVRDGADTFLLPKLHLERSILFFKNLHISKSVKPQLSRYTLKPFDAIEPILEACIATHGDDWLTEPLQKALLQLSWSAAGDGPPPQKAFCSAFGLYRGSTLAAGEFGVFYGGVYTSYSGFYTENSAGTVQMVLTARFLEQKGFTFWDLGMPLEYKTRLGAAGVDRTTFIRMFREARSFQPALEQSLP